MYYGLVHSKNLAGSMVKKVKDILPRLVFTKHLRSVISALLGCTLKKKTSPLK